MCMQGTSFSIKKFFFSLILSHWVLLALAPSPNSISSWRKMYLKQTTREICVKIKHNVERFLILKVIQLFN